MHKKRSLPSLGGGAASASFLGPHAPFSSVPSELGRTLPFSSGRGLYSASGICRGKHAWGQPEQQQPPGPSLICGLCLGPSHYLPSSTLAEVGVSEVHSSSRERNLSSGKCLEIGALLYVQNFWHLCTCCSLCLDTFPKIFTWLFPSCCSGLSSRITSHRGLL